MYWYWHWHNLIYIYILYVYIYCIHILYTYTVYIYINDIIISCIYIYIYTHLALCDMLPPFSCTSQWWSQPTKFGGSLTSDSPTNIWYAYTQAKICMYYLFIIGNLGPISGNRFSTPETGDQVIANGKLFPHLLILRWAMELANWVNWVNWLVNGDNMLYTLVI